MVRRGRASGRLRAAVAALTATGSFLACLGAAPPAAADTLTYWEFSTHAPGMPASDVAARTLASVDLAFVADHRGSRIDGTVVLGAEPEDASAADLRLALGTPLDDGSCDIRWELAIPTLDPGRSAQREGATLDLVVPVAPDAMFWQCGHVALTAPSQAEVVFDRLDGRAGLPAVGEPYARATIGRVSGLRVSAGQWAPVRVTVRLRGMARGATVEGRGPHVAVAPALVPAGRFHRTVTVRVFVKLLADHPSRLRLFARPTGRFATDMPDRRTVRVFPR